MTLYFQYCLYKLLEPPLLIFFYFEPRTCFVIFHSAVFQDISIATCLVWKYTYIFIDLCIWTINVKNKYDYSWKNDRKLANSLHFGINLVSSLEKRGEGLWKYGFCVIILPTSIATAAAILKEIWSKIILRIFICSWNYWFSSYSMYYINYIATLNINIRECFFMILLSCKIFQKKF